MLTTVGSTCCGKPVDEMGHEQTPGVHSSRTCDGNVSCLPSADLAVVVASRSGHVYLMFPLGLVVPLQPVKRTDGLTIACVKSMLWLNEMLQKLSCLHDTPLEKCITIGFLKALLYKLLSILPNGGMCTCV